MHTLSYLDIPCIMSCIGSGLVIVGLIAARKKSVREVEAHDGRASAILNYIVAISGAILTAAAIPAAKYREHLKDSESALENAKREATAEGRHVEQSNALALAIALLDNVESKVSTLAKKPVPTLTVTNRSSPLRLTLLSQYFNESFTQIENKLEDHPAETRTTAESGRNNSSTDALSNALAEELKKSHAEMTALTERLKRVAEIEVLAAKVERGKAIHEAFDRALPTIRSLASFTNSPAQTNIVAIDAQLQLHFPTHLAAPTNPRIVP